MFKKQTDKKKGSSSRAVTLPFSFGVGSPFGLADRNLVFLQEVRELVFGDAVGSARLFPVGTDGRLGAIHLGDGGAVRDGAGPQGHG